MKYFIIEDNYNYAILLKDIVNEFNKDENDRAIILDCNNNKDWKYYLLSQMFLSAKNDEKVCLIIDAELRCNQFSKRSDLEGISLVYKILSSMSLGFEGHIILYGFLPTEILNKMLNKKGIPDFSELKIYGISYIQLPISKENFEAELIKLNQNKSTLFDKNND